MAKPSIRPPVAGPPLLRPLARLTGLPLPAQSPSLPAKLGVWVDWNRAVDLQRALDGRVPAAPEGVPVVTAEALAEAVAAARQTATTAIERLLADLQDSGQATIDWPLVQRRHQAMQRNLFTSTGRLRGLLRDQLALRGGECGRLAAVDAVLEQTLAPHAVQLLSRLPPLLASHAASDAAGAATAPTCDDLQALLLAERDVHFLPLEGLLAALHA